MQRRTFLAFLGMSLAALACRHAGQGGTTTTTGDTNSTDPYGSATGQGNASPPPPVEFIPIWEKHQVPKYPGAEPGQLQPLATQVENGGTLSFAVPDPAEKVLDFYRTTLPSLGWTLQPAPAGALAAKREGAALTVVVKGSEHGTTVLLMLTDAI